MGWPRAQRRERQMIKGRGAESGRRRWAHGNETHQVVSSLSIHDVDCYLSIGKLR